MLERRVIIMAKETNKKTRRPMLSDSARESRLINLAMNLAEEQLENGTATSQVITHFLKAATEKAKYEQEKLKAETQLAMAKIEAMESQKRSELMAEEAIKAFKKYSGEDDEEDYGYD